MRLILSRVGQIGDSELDLFLKINGGNIICILSMETELIE